MDALVRLEAFKNSRIGDLLFEQGYISRETLDNALKEQYRLGERLGRILTHNSQVRPYDLYRSLAHQQALPYANLMAELPDANLVRCELDKEYMRLRAIPWKYVDGRVIIACVELTSEVKVFAAQHYGVYAKFAIASPYDIQYALEKLCGKTLGEHACNYLYRIDPHASARHRNRFVSLTVLLLVALLVTLMSTPTGLHAVIILANCFFLATTVLKIVLFRAGKDGRGVMRLHPYEKLLPDRDLPIYTILVPLYKEARAIPRLLKSLGAIDYPSSRLDIKLIVEEDDKQTLAAIRKAKPPAFFEMVRVPKSEPRTKPKACNLALQFARGEFVTIYDAEDHPDPLQLKKAVTLFRRMPDHVVCLQARLNYYNRRENLLTALFALEYATLFDYLLPGLSRYRIPIPLGGTSNHFKTGILRELGEWDPYNVTEDADLGIRLAAKGYETRPFDSLTLEESPLTLHAWLRQRSRWIKGYMLTWLVAMRRPRQLLDRFGWQGFLGFQLFIGGASLVYLLAPFLWGVSLLWSVGYIPPAYAPPPWILTFCLLVLVTGVGVQWWLAGAVATAHRWWREWPAVLTYPFYWILHSLACFRAIRQLLTAPFYWEKTEHGMTTLLPGTKKAMDFA